MELLLVGGIPSSGSTFLLYLLSQNPKLLCLPETGLFTQGYVFSPNKTNEDNELHLNIPWIDVPLKLYQALGWKLPSENAGNILIDPLNIIKQHIPLHKDQIIVEKTPENIFAFENYLSSNKFRKVIAISRDLESTCASLIKRGFTMIEALIIWFAHGFEIWRLLTRYPEQIFHVRYDELCSAPNSTVSKISKFIGLLSCEDAFSESSIEIRKKYQWILNKSSWFLADRYWSKNIEAPSSQHLLEWKLGIGFESLVDLIYFETPELGKIAPKVLDNALKGNFKSLSSINSQKSIVINLEGRTNIIRCLTSIYPIGYIC